jgi:purine-binding chemotaxis protein CheW
MRASDQGTKQLPTSTVQYLTFLTAGEEYAVAIVKVREIIEYEAVTTVPNTPVWIRGVTNLRGKVVPVVDLATKFGMPAASISKFSCIIITEVMFQGESLVMGVLADSVSQVIELSADEIEHRRLALASKPNTFSAWERWARSFVSSLTSTKCSPPTKCSP